MTALAKAIRAALIVATLMTVPVVPVAGQGIATESGARRSTAPPLTLSEATRGALQHHPTAARAREAVRSAQAGFEEVNATRRPSLYGSGGVVGFQEPMLVAPLHTFEVEELRADPPRFEDVLISSQWTLEYLLWDGGGRGARVAGSEASLLAADLTREALEAVVIESVSAHFLRLRASREVEEAHLLRIRALESELDRVAQALREGVAAPVEELRARAALSESRADLESARAETLRATRELARTIGVDESAVETRRLTAIVPTAAGAEPDSAGRNPSVVAAEHQVEAARQAAQASSGTWWPQLLASAQLNQYGSSNGYFSTEWNLGVGFRYPIYTGGSRGSNIDRAQADLRQTEEALRETELQVETLVDRASTGLTEARARVVALRETVSLMAEVARIERLALEEGAGIQRDLLDAEADLLRARAALIQAEGTEVLARISLARARGTLTADWVDRNLENSQ